MSDTKSSGSLPIGAVILSVVAVVIVAGLPLDENIEVFGVAVPGWLLGVVLYVVGFFAGRLVADRPLLRRRSSSD